MKRTAIIIAIIVGAFAAIATTVTTTYYTQEQVKEAWRKDVITADGEDFTHLNDRQGMFVSRQEVVAEAIAVSNLTEVGEAFSTGFADGIANLSSATNNMPDHGMTFGLVFPLIPSATRTAVEGFVVSNSYDSVKNIDEYVIHFTQSLAIQPQLQFPYITESGFTTNMLKGTFRSADVPGSNWTNVYTVVIGDYEYNNCHKCYVSRPASLRGLSAWIDPHMKWGDSKSGVNYGNIVHTAFGKELFSGVLTNTVNHTYVEIKDGAIMKPGFVSYEP